VSAEAPSATEHTAT